MKKLNTFASGLILSSLIAIGCGARYPGDDQTDDSGHAGTTGSAGSHGYAGTTGSAGTTGNAGTTGAAGTTGSGGSTATGGTTGTGGTSATGGSTGTSGSNGYAGTTGSAGTTGAAGTTGSAETTGNAGTGGTAPSTTPPRGPFMTPGRCEFRFNVEDVNGSPNGEVRGDMPAMTWESGPPANDTDKDGWLEYNPKSVAPGTYNFSYTDQKGPREANQPETWAGYGDEAKIKLMSVTDKSFIQCDWWDAVNQKVLQAVKDQKPSCNIKASVDANCVITAAGNMGNY